MSSLFFLCLKICFVIDTHCKKLNVFSDLFQGEAMTDPGFVRRGGRQPQRQGANLVFWSIFLKKIHENEENYNPREYMSMACPLLDPPMQSLSLEIAS